MLSYIAGDHDYKMIMASLTLFLSCVPLKHQGEEANLHKQKKMRKGRNMAAVRQEVASILNILPEGQS